MPPLVGRDPELATIDRFLRSVGEGYQAVVFRGGAGYGKSALLEETVDRARAAGFRALTARPTETEAELPFGVLAELLEPVATSDLDLPAPQTRALDVALRRADPDEAHPVDPLGLSLAVSQRSGRSRRNSRSLSRLTTCSGATRPHCGRSISLSGVWMTRQSGSRPGCVSASGDPAARRRGPRHRRRRRAAGRPGLRDRRASQCSASQTGASTAVRGVRWQSAVRQGSGGAARRERASRRPGRADSGFGLRVRRDRTARREARPRHARRPSGAAALPRPTVDILLAAYEEQEVEEALVEAAAAGIVALTANGSASPIHSSQRRCTRPPRRPGAVLPTRRLRERLTARRSGRRISRSQPPRASAAVAAELESAAAAARARGALDTAGRLLEQAVTVTPGRDRAARRRRGLEAARCQHAAGDTDRARSLLDRAVDLSRPGEEVAEVLLELALAGGTYSQRGFGYAYAALENAQQSPALAVRIHHCLMGLHVCSRAKPRAPSSTLMPRSRPPRGWKTKPRSRRRSPAPSSPTSCAANPSTSMSSSGQSRSSVGRGIDVGGRGSAPHDARPRLEASGRVRPLAGDLPRTAGRGRRAWR